MRTSTGTQATPDTFGTTIRFRVFDDVDEEEFYGYADDHVTHHQGFSTAPEPLRNAISRGLLELFTNASLHSRALHGIAASGQFFPKKKLMQFCLADAGVGIHHNVGRLINGMDDASAVVWAMQSGNTTRVDDVPGGLGLGDLADFIIRNGGKLILASGLGYVELDKEGMRKRTLAYSFPGTVARVVIRTDGSC